MSDLDVLPCRHHHAAGAGAGPRAKSIAVGFRVDAGIELDAEERQRLAGERTDLYRALADATGEDDGVQPPIAAAIAATPATNRWR